MTPAGIVVALAAIFMSMIMTHGKPMTIVSIPSMVLVLGGTIGVSIAGVNKHDLKPVRGALLAAVKNKVTWHASDFNQHLLTAAKEARTMGLLALENGLPEAKVDPFVRSGVELITTTSDPERVRNVLDAEIIGMRARHRVGIKFFQDMGGFAPTIGILGTVIGLVRVLGDLSSPATLGPAIASAFTATLWGVMTANIFWIPISNKLKRLSDDEVRRKELVIEGLLAVQEGLTGPQLRDRLDPFLAPRERGDQGKGPGASAEESAA
ncbi:MAG: motility protein A [Acidimicrobiales bacterium]